MKRFQDQSGATLVELLVTIVVSSIVMLAATSMLLMGIRMGAFGNSNASAQNRIQVFQKLVSEAEDITGINVVPLARTEVDLNGVENSCTAWSIVTDGSNVLVSYKDNTIYLGNPDSSQVLFDKVESTSVALTNGTEKYLMTLSITLEENKYKMSFCKKGTLTKMVNQSESAQQLSSRAISLTSNIDDLDVESSIAEVDSKTAKEKALAKIKELEPSPIAKVGREKFIDCLFKQINSKGEILGAMDDYEYSYYSEWYIGGYKEGSDWNANTPWCACYISWILEDFQDTILEHTPRFADVVKGVEYFQNCEKEMYGTVSHWSNPEDAEPLPGDLVFFDWNEDGTPEHVGVVLYAENEKLYTIEGNVDDQVKTLSYSLQDSTILGYGSLHWK